MNINPFVEYSIVYKLKGDEYSHAFTNNYIDYELALQQAKEWAEREDVVYVRVDKITTTYEKHVVVKE